MVEQNPKRGSKNYIKIMMGLVLLGFCLFGYLNMVAYDEVLLVALVLFYGTVGLFVLLALGLILYFTLMAYESWRTRRADRIAKERESALQVVTAPRGEQVYIKTGQGWWSAHQDPRLVVNGHDAEITETDMQTLQMYLHAMAHRAGGPGTYVEPPLALPSGPGPNLMDLLSKTQVAFIIGNRDSGKTTLMQHMQAERAQRGQVIVIDPHTFPDKYPPGVKVYGAGRNYAEIKDTLRVILALMDTRFAEIRDGFVGERQHPLQSLFIDEWRAITQSEECGHFAAKTIKTLISESRKTNIDMVVSSHSDRVEALGVKGAGDLLDGIVFVRLRMNPTTGERSAMYDDGMNSYAVQLPGPFGMTVETIEQRAARMYAQGESVSAIAQELFGNKGGPQNTEVKRMLRMM